MEIKHTPIYSRCASAQPMHYKFEPFPKPDYMLAANDLDQRLRHMLAANDLDC